MDPPDGFTISDSWTSHYVGRVWADGEKYEVDGGTTDDREATIKITVKAEADD